MSLAARMLPLVLGASLTATNSASLFAMTEVEPLKHAQNATDQGHCGRHCGKYGGYCGSHKSPWSPSAPEGTPHSVNPQEAAETPCALRVLPNSANEFGTATYLPTTAPDP